jgi:hypothetical protein
MMYVFTDTLDWRFPMTKINSTPFSSRMGIAALGLWMQREKIWQAVEQRVRIEQKVVRYRPIEKLLDAFINIVSGGERMVEVNTRVRSDEGLQRAFSRQGCAEQSVVSTTLNRCTEENVVQMQAALVDIYRRHSQGYGHDYRRCWQVLDVDMSGLVVGRQAEGATKGYFARRKGVRGRQLGRVTASRYDEIVYQKLYPGKVQLENSLQELVSQAEQVLELTPGQRAKTVIRVDGGGGRDADINWLFGQGYGVLAKAHNWQRCRKMAETVTTWHADQKEVGRQAGWVTAPHLYDQDTQQVVVRKRKEDGNWQLSLLVNSLPTSVLFELVGLPPCPSPTSEQLLWAIVYAYDLRSGGVETAFRQSKEGLHIHRRNKRRFDAQEMLLLLAQLAQNVLLWFRRLLAKHASKWRRYGIKRLLRDILSIPGRLCLDGRGQIIGLIFDQQQPSAATFARAAALGIFIDDLSLYLDKI